MKKVTKILTIVLLVAMIVLSVSEVFAAGGLITNIEQASNTTVNMGTLPQTIGKVIAYIRNAAIIIGIVIILILGIKYMTGSVEEKANYKKTSMNIIIGVVFITLVTSIVDVIFSAFNL